jgi:hypothetical protein
MEQILCFILLILRRQKTEFYVPLFVFCFRRRRSAIGFFSAIRKAMTESSVCVRVFPVVI